MFGLIIAHMPSFCIQLLKLGPFVFKVQCLKVVVCSNQILDDKALASAHSSLHLA